MNDHTPNSEFQQTNNDISSYKTGLVRRSGNLITHDELIELMECATPNCNNNNLSDNPVIPNYSDMLNCNRQQADTNVSVLSNDVNMLLSRQEIYDGAPEEIEIQTFETIFTDNAQRDSAEFNSDVTVTHDHNNAIIRDPDQFFTSSSSHVLQITDDIPHVKVNVIDIHHATHSGAPRGPKARASGAPYFRKYNHRVDF